MNVTDLLDQVPGSAITLCGQTTIWQYREKAASGTNKLQTVCNERRGQAALHARVAEAGSI
jgi:hypothetical protein